MQTDIHFTVNWWDILKFGAGAAVATVVMVGFLAYWLRGGVYNP